ncbi:MAG: glycine zipper 2TM domain-containing protein [Burkholderiaceae bacterium]|jgi:osmotically inducible lipoprotein OsmB
MKTIQKFAFSAMTAAMLLGLGGCAGMSEQDKGTAIGAGAGAIGGSILTGGSAVGTVGGAVVGGVIGNQVTKP